jgi:hypothetical protein
LILTYYKLAEWCVSVWEVGKNIKHTNLVNLICDLLHQHSELHTNTVLPLSSADYLDFTKSHPLMTYNSAVATFYASSDYSEIEGM